MSDRRLDLSDPLVRGMALRNHYPRELWSMAGELMSVSCGQCGNHWPCETIEALRSLPAEMREDRW